MRFNVRFGLGLQVSTDKAVEVDREVLPVLFLVLNIETLDRSRIRLLIDGDAHLLDHDLAVSSDNRLQFLELDLRQVGSGLFLCEGKILDHLLMRYQGHAVPGPVQSDVRPLALPGELVFQIQPVR